MRKTITFFCIVSLLASVVSSCIKEGDFDSVEIKLRPTISAPLINAELSMEDLISITGMPSSIQINSSNNGIWMHYDADTIAYNQTITPIGIGGEVTFTIENYYDISEFFKNEQSGDIRLDSAMLNICMKINENPLNLKLSNIKLEIITKDNQTIAIPFQTTLDLGALPPNKFDTLLSINIGELYSDYQPVSLKYHFDVTATFDAIETNTNIQFLVAPSLNVLLKGSASNLTYTDTIDFPLDLNIESLDKLDENSEVTLFFDFQNSFPFDLNVQFYLMDEATMTVQDSIFSNAKLIESAPVNESGTSTGFGTVAEEDIKITIDRLKKMNTLKKASFWGSFSTADVEQNKTVKILPSNKLKVKMGVKATIDSDDILN